VKKFILCLLLSLCLLLTLAGCAEKPADKNAQEAAGNPSGTAQAPLSGAYVDSTPVTDETSDREQEALSAPPSPGVLTREEESQPPPPAEPEQEPVTEPLKPEAEQTPEESLPPQPEVPPQPENPAENSGSVHTNVLVPVASGVLSVSGGGAEIDWSNTADGYVMVRYTGSSNSKLKVLVKGPSTTYTYTLPKGSWTVFPLSDGNGSYQVTAYENVTGSKYAALQSAGFTAQMTDEFAPFLRPNQYVDFAGATATVSKAAELCRGVDQPLLMVEAVYDYVVKSLSYDKAKAAAVKSGYLPQLDQVLAEKKGICFDYAALMAGMLRSQGVPCKLVVGYAGSAYHAWISVWTEESGWVEGAIFFDGNTWHRMDPTFASSGNQSQSIMEYIGNGANYTAKYLY